MRCKQDRIPLKLFQLCILAQVHKIKCRVRFLGRCENAFLGGLLDPAMPVVHISVKLVVHCLKYAEAGIRIRAADFLNLLQIFCKRFDFTQPAVVTAVIVQDAVPVNFCPHRARAPAEEGDIIRPVRHALHGPELQLSRTRHGGFHPVIPSVRAGLLLHDAKVRADRTDPGQVQGGMPVMQAVLVPGLINPVGKVRITVIHIDVQDVPGHLMIVQPAEHSIGRHKHARFDELPENLCLHGTERQRACGHKAHVIQEQRRVVGCNGIGMRHIDLFPVCIGLAPEHRSPGFVERIKRSVLFLQEHTECLPIRLGEEIIGFTVQFIVDLPADNRRMPAPVFGHFSDQEGHLLTVDRTVVIIMPPAAVAVKHAIRIGVERFRIPAGQPGRGRGGRGSENHLHAGGCTQVEEPVKEGKVKAAFLPFHNRPGKLTDAHSVNAVVQHPLQIAFPEGFIPVFRIIAHAGRHGFQKVHDDTFLSKNDC